MSARVSKRPQSWKKGDPINSPVIESIALDPREMIARERYKFLIGAVVPRPIAFITTCNADGVINLAPFSFFNGVASNPLTVTISIARGVSKEKKDTLSNIEANGEFVVNSANQWLVDPLVLTAGDFPYGVSELEEAGLTPVPSLKVAPPRVKECAWQMECKVYKLVPVGDQNELGSSMLIIGEVVMMHIDKQAYHEGRIDINQIAPVARLGGFGYGELGTTYEIPIPAVGETK